MVSDNHAPLGMQPETVGFLYQGDRSRATEAQLKIEGQPASGLSLSNDGLGICLHAPNVRSLGVKQSNLWMELLLN